MTKTAKTSGITYSVIVGGTLEEPVRKSECEPATVAGLAAGAKQTQLLALNFLFGNVSPELTTDIGLDKAFHARSAKNDKTATKFLISCTTQSIRRAWEEDIASRKRYTEPTLQALAKLVKALDKEPSEKKLSLAEQVAAILALTTIGDTEKVAAIAKLDQIMKQMGTAS